MRKKLLGAICLLAFGLVRSLYGETFLVLVQELRNGEAGPRPFASQEGLLSAMFDLGQITFETGPYQPAVDWEGHSFAEALALARQGGARYLATLQVDTQVVPQAEGNGVEIRGRAIFLLFDAAGSRLLGQGEMEISSTADGGEPTYEDFLFRTGENVAREVLKLCPREASLGG
jgi:hypothetical protein